MHNAPLFSKFLIVRFFFFTALITLLSLFSATSSVFAGVAMPSPPSNLQVAFNGLNDVSVFWINAESDYDGIIIERRNMGGDNLWYPVQVVGGATVLTKDDGLLCQGAYFYRVYAVRDNVVSTYSNEAGTGLIDCVFQGAILVQDGGFEGGSLNPLFWKKQNLSADKIFCDRLKPDYSFVEVSDTGRCAFRFQGKAGENSMIEQTSDPDMVATLNEDDQIRFSAMVRAKNLTTGAVIKVLVSYPNNAGTSVPVAKRTMNIAPGTYDYTEVARSLTLEATPKKIRFQIRNKATGGLMFVDSIRFGEVILK